VETESLHCGLIPAPAVIREKLAFNYVQARFLRRLLRVAEDASIEAEDRRHRGRQPESPRPGGGAP
jgi:hypothetical protein